MGTPRATMVLPVHGITRYLRVRITTYDDVLVIEDRRSLFGLIPLWRRRMEVANGEISSGEVHNVVRATCLLASIALLAPIFAANPPMGVSAILGLAAAPMAFLAFVKGLRVTRSDGRRWTFPMCRYYAFDAELALFDAIETARGPAIAPRTLAHAP